RTSDFRITACTWAHKKWPHTTQDGKILLRCYVGKPNDQAVVDLSDEEITDIVLKDLKRTMKIKGEPEFTVVTRWKNIMPQYTIGHKERIEKVRNVVAVQLPGVFLAGSAYEVVGIPDCIGEGEKAVDEVLSYVQKKSGNVLEAHCKAVFILVGIMHHSFPVHQSMNQHMRLHL